MKNLVSILLLIPGLTCLGATISGTVTYSGSHTGAVYVTVAQPRPAGSNQVLHVPGSGGYAVTTLTDLSGSASGGNGSALSVEYWFKGSVVQSAVRQQAADYIVVGWNNLAILSNDGGVGAGLNLGASVTDGNWHHVAMTWQQGTKNGFCTYLDGALVASRDSGTTPIPNMNAQVYFGCFNASAEFMNGLLDEVAIWNRALSVDEIRSNMHTGLTGKETGLAGYWTFDDGVGKDLTSAGNDASVLGTAEIIQVDIPGLGPRFTTQLSGPGTYQIASVPLFNGCVLSAFMDTNTNGSPDATEPRSPTAIPFNLTGDLPGANLTLYDPPAITAQPTNVTVTAGGTITLNVTAVGSAPLSYQWLRVGTVVSNGGRFQGAQTSQLQVTSAQLSDEGPYTLVVTNPAGSVISAPIAVLVPSLSTTNGLVAHWTFDASSGTTLADSSGSGNNGTVANASGDPAQWTSGMIGGALSFRGTNLNNSGSVYEDYVTVPNFPVLTNTFSVSGWVWADPRDGTWPQTAVLGDGNATGSGPGPIGLVLQQKNRDQLFGPLGDQFTDSVAAHTANDTAGLPTGAWQQIGVVANGSTMTVYRNGAPVASTTYSGLLPAPTSEFLGLGAFVDDSGNPTGGYWLGKIDDVGVWSHALTADQMAATFLAGLAGKDLAKADTFLHAAPVILAQPQGQTLFAGGGLLLAVQAVGPGGLTYQWSRNTTPITGATNANYYVASAQPADSGQYAVAVTSPYGTTNSTSVTVNIQTVTFSTGLAGYWRMDETNGLTAADSSSNHDDGQLGNFPGDDSQWVTGQVGGAVAFVSASSEYLYVPQCPAATNTLSVSLWAYANSRPNWATFVKNWGASLAGQFHFGLYANGGQENIYIKQADGKTPNVSDPVLFPLGSWQHVAFVCDGSNVLLYRNGALVASTTYNGTFIPPVTPAIGIGVKLGDNGTSPDTGNPGYWDGMLDDVAIWDRGLSPTEIKAVYQAGLAGKGVLQAGDFLTPPTLTVAVSGKNVVISWPYSYTGYTLESASTLSGATWKAVSGVSGNTVTVPIGAGNSFFRLRQ